jgi:hypothetical protein
MGIICFVDRDGVEIDVPISRFLLSSLVDEAQRIGRSSSAWREILELFTINWQVLYLSEMPIALQQEFAEGLSQIVKAMRTKDEFHGFNKNEVTELLTKLISNTRAQIQSSRAP